MGQDVHAVRRVRGFLSARERMGTHPAENFHDDPCREARGSAAIGLNVDVYLLLQLHRALSAQVAHHPHHAWLGTLCHTALAWHPKASRRASLPNYFGTIW